MEEKIFYKFKNINENTLNSLTQRYMYFSIPEKLNDPEDCQIPVVEDSSDENIIKWIKHVIALSNTLGGNPHRFDNLTINSFRELVNNKTIDLAAAAKKASNNFHIFSLTDCNSTFDMWTHEDYCVNFSGICIGYKAVKLQDEYPNYYLSINNHNPMRTIEVPAKVKLPFCILKKIEYDNDRQHKYNMFEQGYSEDFVTQIQSKKQNEIIMYNLFHKTQNWSKEREYRGFYFNPINNDDSIVYHPDEIIENIGFGNNCTKENRRKIFDIMKTYSNFDEIKFYEASPNQENNKVIIRPIDKNDLEAL